MHNHIHPPVTLRVEPDWPVIHAFLGLAPRYGLSRTGFIRAPVVTLIALDDFDAPSRLETEGWLEPGPLCSHADFITRATMLGHPALAPREAWIDWTVVYAATHLAERGVRYAAFREAPWAHLHAHGMASALECLAHGFQPLLPAQAAVAKRLRAAAGDDGEAG